MIVGVGVAAVLVPGVVRVDPHGALQRQRLGGRRGGLVVALGDGRRRAADAGMPPPVPGVHQDGLLLALDVLHNLPLLLPLATPPRLLLGDPVDRPRCRRRRRLGPRIAERMGDGRQVGPPHRRLVGVATTEGGPGVQRVVRPGDEGRDLAGEAAGVVQRLLSHRQRDPHRAAREDRAAADDGRLREGREVVGAADEAGRRAGGVVGRHGGGGLLRDGEFPVREEGHLRPDLRCGDGGARAAPAVDEDGGRGWLADAVDGEDGDFAAETSTVCR